MIEDYQVQRRGDEIILGLAIDNAVLDIVTTAPLLQECLRILTAPRDSWEDTIMGRFGDYEVTLNRPAEGEISIFIDGPRFDDTRVQSSAIWPGLESLVKVIEAVLTDGQQGNG